MTPERDALRRLVDAVTYGAGVTQACIEAQRVLDGKDPASGLPASEPGPVDPCSGHFSCCMAKGAEEERRAVVEWLKHRSRAGNFYGDLIERGDHRSKSGSMSVTEPKP